MFTTPSRLARRLQEQEEELGELPSLPGPPSFSAADDYNFEDESSDSIPAFRDALTTSDGRLSMGSHSTPPHLSNSNSSRSARSTTSTERFAASLQQSQTSARSKARGQSEFSFEVSKIEHTPHDLANISALVVDDESQLDVPSFAIPVVHEPDDASVSDPMESISLSTTSRNSDEPAEPPAVCICIFMPITIPS